MNTNHHAVLFALLDLARTDRHATVLRLAQHAGLERAEVELALRALDRAGLVDEARVRLTMHGLAAAAMMGAPRASKGRAVARRAA
jgi:predicted transcriptional regulator